MKISLASLWKVSAALIALSPLSAFADGAPEQDPNAVPKILIVRVPAVGQAADQTAQAPESEADVYPLVDVTLYRKADGTVDVDRVRAQVLNLMMHTTPVRIESIDLGVAEVPNELQQGFAQAEEQTDDAAEKPVVRWRGYGPVRGYYGGVVAYNRSAYRGYYPGSTYPYYGWYRSYPGRAAGVVYHYHYGVYRRTPSYHYYAYYRQY